MATAGLSFANPLLDKVSVGEEPNPYAPYNPTSSIGAGGLAPSAADMAVMGDSLVKQSQFTMPKMTQPPSIAFSPTTNELFVNGITFRADDAATALQSEQYLRGPGTGLPQGGDWVPLDEQAYGQLLQSIRQPSLGRLASKNFGRGVDSMQLLAGRGLQLAGAEQTGGNIVAQQAEELRRTSPYERQFTDIESGRGAVEWLVANFAQQGPNMIESIATAGVGMLAGTAAGGPLAGAGGAIAGLMGKSAFKEAVIAAATKKAAGTALNAAENKLLREAAGLAGAVAASYTQNLATGAADIYGELRDQGADATDVDARIKALAGSVPYAALETLPEFLLASRVFGNVMAPRAMPAGTSLRARGAEMLRRGAVGFGVGGTAEGTTEMGQEGLLLGLSGQDMSSPENTQRLINSFAAGFGIGGPLGAVANLRGKQPENLLDPAKSPEQTPGRELVPVEGTGFTGFPRGGYTPAPPGTAVAPYYTPTTPTGAAPGVGGEPALGGPPAMAGQLQLPGPTPAISPVGGPVIMAGMGPGAVDVTRQDLLLRQQGNVPPGAQPGSQGVLDIFGGTIPAQELAARMQPQQPLPALPAPTPVVTPDPRQGALQFAGPAPVAPTNPQMANQLQVVQDRIRRQREFEQAQAQQQALIAQQTEAIAQQSRNARDLYAMQQAQQQAAAQQPMPMRPAGPTQPQQLPLFTRRQAPVPPKAGQLRRGGQMQVAAPVAAPQAAGGTQVPLFTQAGEPSVAALRAAGVKTKLPPTPAKPRATKTAGARGLRKGAKVAEITVRDLALQEQRAAGWNTDWPFIPTDLVNADFRKLIATDPGLSLEERKQVFAAGKKLGVISQSENVEDYLPKEPQNATKTGKLKQGRVAERPQDNAGVQGGGNAGNKPATQVQTGGAQAGGGGKPVVSGPSKTETLKKAKPTQRPAVQMKAAAFRSRKTGEVIETGPVHNRYKLPGGSVSDLKEWEAGFVDTNNTFYNREEAARAIGSDKKELRTEDFGATTGLQPPPKKEVTQPPKAEAATAAAPAVTETPAETWAAMDTGVEWAALSPEQQTRWADSDRAQNTADTIAEDVRNPQTPEALWEDMKPEGAPAYGDLPAPVRAQWRQDATAGKATIQRAEEILGDMEETPLQLVNSEFASAEAATDIRDFRDAINTVVEYAYFISEETNTKAAVMRARELLASTAFTDAQQNAIDAAMLDVVNMLKDVEAVYTRGATKGDSKPWFDYAVQRGLLPRITTVVKGLSIDAATKMLDSGQLRIGNLPADTVKKYKASAPAVSGVIGKAGAKLKNDTRANPATTLADYIKQINTYSGQPYNETKRTKETKTLRDMWAAVRAAGMEDFADQNGNLLGDYFDADGNPNVGRIGGQFRVATEEITEAVQLKREKIIAEDKIVADDDYEAPFSLEDWNIGRDDDFSDGRYFRDDGTPINAPIPLGRVKMLVSAFLSKLNIKPKVQIYRNQADFKAKNPSLYAQAVASRPQGDFDTASAVGYSFGDGNVIIFADRVATEQQLKFVLAHETLGHFGFRGLLTEKELNAALDGVYNSSAKVKAAVDTAMKARKMSQREATEEYLADFAGMLDTNIIARFWNAIKNALNKLGMRFDDDAARYLVSQSRRYVRNGQASGSFMDFKAMAQRMSTIEGMTDPDGSGRFALAGEYYDEINRVAASNAMGQRATKLFDITNLFQNLKDRGINLEDYGNRLIGELKSMNYAARENQGYRRLYDIFRDTSKTAAQLRAQYNKMMDTVLSPAVEVLGRGFTQGATEAQIAITSSMLNVTSRVKLGKLTEAELRKIGSLINIENGEARLNQEVYDILAARGKFTLDDFKKGIKYTIGRATPMTAERRAAIEAERDREISIAESDKERKAIARQYQKELDNPSYIEEVEQTYAALPNLTEQSPEWIMYNEVRDTVNKSAIDMLLANFAAAKGERDNVERVVQQFLDRTLTENDKSFIKTIEDKYLELRSAGATVDQRGVLLNNRESVARANDFVKKFNTAVLGLATDRNKAVQEFFDQAQADDVFKGIEALKAGSNIPHGNEKLKFTMQNAIQNLALFEISKTDAELLAKRSIAGGYVPFGREGSWQIRVQAVDPKTGRIFKVSEQYRAQLLFMQVENRADAENAAERIQAIFDSVKDGFEMEVLDGTEFVIKKVKLVAQPETSRETVSTTAEANLNEIISAITRFSISITPEERERLIVGLTEQNAKARSRLKRANTPGEDPNTIKYVSQHLESTASTVARKQNRHRLDRLFDEANPDSKNLWYGDETEYNKRKAAWEKAQKDPTMSEAKRLAAKREFDDYHYTFVTKESPKMGNRFKDRGRRAVAFMESQSNVDYTDFASGEAASAIRTATTFAFMGASFATAILNYLSLATNVLPAFSGYNQKNSFGGGFGWGMSSVEIARAASITKGFGQSEVKFWDDLLADPAKLKASGFTDAEARFMQKEVGGGTMQAALTNSLLGSARGKFRSGATKAFAETWMSLFNYTEQHSRRATGLSAFRMAYARALVEGKDAATAFELADKFAVDMIDNTLGEYAMYNRPAMFRGDVRQFLFMFKMFPVNSIQMLAALPRKEQLLALGILALFAGLKGLPFAEDLMDLLDTIAQGLGLGTNKVWRGSAEKSLAEALDAIAPGMTPVLMRGLLNTITPANVSDRISLSNIIPGTGIALAGADVGRELIEIAGPVASFLQGAVSMGADVTKFGLGTVGVLDDTTSFNKIARESPIAMLRAVGDMMAYNNAGAIVSQKGFVVSEDLHLGTMLTRALGFYPSAAVAENDVVRLSKRIGDYQKDVAGIYRGLYITAKIGKDNERAAEVVQMVQDWNEASAGSGLEIRNFQQSANRALREAQRTATERFLRTQPKAMRPETERMLAMYGVTE